MAKSAKKKRKKKEPLSLSFSVRELENCQDNHPSRETPHTQAQVNDLLPQYYSVSTVSEKRREAQRHPKKILHCRLFSTLSLSLSLPVPISHYRTAEKERENISSSLTFSSLLLLLFISQNSKSTLSSLQTEAPINKLGK